jgi:hypothetical protein
VKRNIKEASMAMCGIVMEASYTAKKFSNPPNPGFYLISLMKPPSMCDNYMELFSSQLFHLLQ